MLTAFVTLATGAVFLMGGTGPDPLQTASPSPSAPPVTPRYLPADIPADLEHGVIDTPIGSARWVRLSGTNNTLPGPLSPMPGPSGLLWFDPGGDYPVLCGETDTRDCWSRPELWSSPDAISERAELPLPLAAERAGLTKLGDRWWLTTHGPATVWWSADALRWTQVALGDPAPRAPSGLSWETFLGAPERAGDIVVVPVTSIALNPGQHLGHPDPIWTAWPEPMGADRYRVMLNSGRDPVEVGEVRIQQAAGRLRISDAVTGALIADLGEVPPEFLRTWTANRAIVDHHMAVIDGATVTFEKLDGPALDDPYGGEPVAVLGTEVGFRVFRSAPDGTIRTWNSMDGHSWLEGPLLGDEIGEPRDVDWISVPSEWRRPPSVEARMSAEDGGAWVSDDGAVWSFVPFQPDRDLPARLADGWIRSTHPGWQVSLDGETWSQAAELEQLFPAWSGGPTGAGSAVSEYLGDTLFYARDDFERAQRVLWVVEFEPGP